MDNKAQNRIQILTIISAEVRKTIKKSILKIFLEETERVNKNGHEAKFDFIREFVRYNIGDHPVFYFDWRLGVFVPKDLSTFRDPQIRFEDNYRPKWLINNYGFFEFELLHHTFSVPITREYDLMSDLYLKDTKKIKKGTFNSIIKIVKFTDMDITYRFLKFDK